MKFKLSVLFILFFPLILNSENWEFCYRLVDGGIHQAYEVVSGPSIIPYSHTRRLAFKCVRVENAPASWTTANLMDYKVDFGVLASSTIIVLGDGITATSTTFYQGSNGKLINFKSVEFQEGIILPK